MDSIKKRCLTCGWPANNGDRYCCKCGGNSFDRDDDYIPSYSLFGFPPCECLSNGRTIKYKPSYRDASEITLKIKNVCQVFDSYIIYAAEKIVGEHHSDIEIAELYIKGKDHRSSDGSRIVSQHIVDGILEQSFFDFIAQDSDFPLRQIFEYYNDEYGLSENCIRANNTLYYVLTKPSCKSDVHSSKCSIGTTTIPLGSVMCKHCGTIFSAKDKYCPKCGKCSQTWTDRVRKAIKQLTPILLLIISVYSIYISYKYFQLKAITDFLSVEYKSELENISNELQSQEAYIVQNQRRDYSEQTYNLNNVQRFEITLHNGCEYIENYKLYSDSIVYEKINAREKKSNKRAISISKNDYNSLIESIKWNKGYYFQRLIHTCGRKSIQYQYYNAQDSLLLSYDDEDCVDNNIRTIEDRVTKFVEKHLKNTIIR